MVKGTRQNLQRGTQLWPLCNPGRFLPSLCLSLPVWSLDKFYLIGWLGEAVRYIKGLQERLTK